jgi:hypothetical protein
VNTSLEGKVGVSDYRGSFGLPYKYKKRFHWDSYFVRSFAESGVVNSEHKFGGNFQASSSHNSCCTRFRDSLNQRVLFCIHRENTILFWSNGQLFTEIS